MVRERGVATAERTAEVGGETRGGEGGSGCTVRRKGRGYKAEGAGLEAERGAQRRETAARGEGRGFGTPMCGAEGWGRPHGCVGRRKARSVGQLWGCEFHPLLWGTMEMCGAAIVGLSAP